MGYVTSVTLAWNNADVEVNPKVKVNLWLANPWVNPCLERPALSVRETPAIG